MTLDLDAIRKRAEKAGAREWAYQENADAYTHIVRGPNNEFICQLGQDASGKAEARARFIADAPALLAALAERDERIRELREALNWLLPHAARTINTFPLSDSSWRRLDEIRAALAKGA